tara:strand:- start:5106 stop:5645 length:540 start_codon:yes stop_codon:yes gene_type:complete
MKNLLFLVLSIILISCSSVTKDEKNIIDANAQTEKDIEMYTKVWDTFIQDGDTSVVNEENFTTDVVIITDQGDIVGIDATKAYYENYITAFSDRDWKIIDAFGQGDKLIKHWNFKGKHTGEFFGIPATGNYLDLSGTTIVTMKDGKIAKEHDFFNMKSLLDQINNSSGDITIDEYQPIN